MTDVELDMTMMFATHDALRRDLARVVHPDARTEGWRTFERMLRVHHQAEDDQAMAQQVGPDMPTYLPWLLEGADQDTITRVLSLVPPPVREAYTEQWRPAFIALDRWAVNVSTS